MKNYFLKNNNKIYIISGTFKGRKLSFKNIPGLRPTTNRIRETLFNWLSSLNLKNTNCLDCFAGTGALGIETISRFSVSVTSLEIEKKAVLEIKKNIKKLNISNLKVIHTNSLYWLQKTGKPYDIIFIDPPYHQNLIHKTLILLEKNKWLKKKSIVYIEKEKTKPLIMSHHWILYKKKTTSQIECYLYIFNG